MRDAAGGKTVAAALLAVAGLLAGMGEQAQAERLDHETVTVDVEEAERLEVTVEFAAGEIRLFPERMAAAAQFDIAQDPDRFAFDVEYDVRGDTGHLLAKSRTKRKLGIDTSENIWDIALSTRYPLSLVLEVGACEADIELGELRLEDLKLEVGAADASIDFSEPNPVRMRRMEIDAGAAALEMHDVGNANFENLTFSGGVGAFELDLRGEYTGDARIDIEIGLGAGDIILPRGIPCRVTTDGAGWLSSVTFHHDDLERISENVYQSPDYEDADIRLRVNLDIGLGAADLSWRW